MSTNIVVRIIGELKDAGFIKAEKRSSALEKKFDKLGKTAKRTFLAIAGIGALKKSITAFAAEDKAVRQLTVSLNNLGLAYNVPALEAFIKQTELATGVSGEQLRPAIRDLVATTLDAEQATQLLNTALDLAAGTGASLDATVNALTRAFNGNFASLGKIQTRYTSAELEAMGFAEAVATLNGEFKGTSAAAADSYQGKIDRLSTALGDAAKIIGEDVLQALEKLADGDFDKVLSGIANAANFLGSAFNSLAFSLAYTREFLGTGFKIDAGEQAKLDAIKNQFFPTPGFGGTRANPALLRDYAKQLELQKKIVKEREKAAKLSEKDKKNQQALSKAQNTLDLERIQIQAALQGRITENERLRLELMRAVLNENAARAQQLQAELKQSQEDTAKLAESLTKFVANDPFTAWNNYYEAQTSDAGQLQGDLNKFLANNPFFPWEAEFGAQSDATGQLNAELKTFDANDPFAFWEKHFEFQKKEKENLDKELDTFEADDPFKNWDDYFTDQNNNIEALKANLTSLAALQASTTLAAASDAATSTVDILSNETDLASLASDLAIGGLGLEGLNLSGLDILGGLSGLGGHGIPNNIVVNVAGSVTSSEDLVTFILNELYRLQNSGVAVEIL